MSERIIPSAESQKQKQDDDLKAVVCAAGMWTQGTIFFEALRQVGILPAIESSTTLLAEIIIDRLAAVRESRNAYRLGGNENGTA